MIQVAAAVKVLVDYRDYDYDLLGIDPDSYVIEITDDKKELVIPADFDELAPLEQAFYKEVKDGIYFGTLKNGLPHGYGELIFKEGVNYSHK